MQHPWRIYAIAPAALLLAGCEGRQSVLSPAGQDASDVLNLFWVMLVGAVILWGLVALLFIYVTRINPGAMRRRTAEMLIVGGGILFPVVLLGGLLMYSLPLMGPTRAEGDGLVVRVTAEQWWWRVEYQQQGETRTIVSANELRLPAGARTELVLNAHRVIHSFWVPALGGKTDMFPGRETRMTLAPTDPGIYRGQCAEFCGASHALMAFETVVMPPDEFDQWLSAEARDAKPPQGTLAQAGATLFLDEGCGACHTIRGTKAIGKTGPDLTHLANRHSLAAGTLPLNAQAIATWIGHTDTIKPEVNMPTYDFLSDDDLAALAAYLGGLE